ncbi:MAG: type II toxin-antitoxin system VapC family toxin [Caulobacter sp.]|nr:type II toxin-antitoxin system VapC family toxin [Caulobacter sp.]
MFLLDTNVLSELRRSGVGKADANVLRWIEGRESTEDYVSAITILELEKGVLSMERRDSHQGAIFRRWLDGSVLPLFSGRILPVDLDVALRAAALHVPDPRPDRDALIAATALVHGMTVVTRNVADFEPTGVALLNPWRVQT